jgi:hypothetical protein
MALRLVSGYIRLLGAAPRQVGIYHLTNNTGSLIDLNFACPLPLDIVG